MQRQDEDSVVVGTEASSCMVTEASRMGQHSVDRCGQGGLWRTHQEVAWSVKGQHLRILKFNAINGRDELVPVTLEVQIFPKQRAATLSVEELHTRGYN